MTLTYRPVTPEDEPFLLELYASTRHEELAAVPWTEAQRQAFLQMQFAAQQGHYRERYPAANHRIILWQGQAAGRLYVAHDPHEVRILDLTVLPELRNRGIGTAVLHSLASRAAEMDLPLRIYVENFNPARRLFARLGFTPTSSTGFHDLWEWRNARPLPTSTSDAEGDFS